MLRMSNFGGNVVAIISVININKLPVHILFRNIIIYFAIDYLNVDNVMSNHAIY